MAEDHLLDVAAKIVDSVNVDWAEAERRAPSGHDRAVLRSLRVLADISNLANEPSSQRTDDSVQSLTPPIMWGHLRILNELGRGGFGTVFRAWDCTLEREVALKLVNSSVLPQGVTVSRLLREGRRLARVRHPNVVTVHGADARDGRVGLWMEVITGYTLRELLDAQGPFSAREAAGIAMDLCRALAAVHRAGLVHGDIKASNVMREDGGRVVLMDFGAVRRISPQGARGDGIQGTPLYLAPEILVGDKRPSVVSDIYSLGVLLYQLVSGKYPFTGAGAELLLAHHRGLRTPLIDARPDLPSAFVDVVERCLSPDVSARYQTAGQLGAALGQVTGAPFERERLHTPWVTIAAGIAAVIAGAVVARVAWPPMDSAPTTSTSPVDPVNPMGAATPRDLPFRVGATFYSVKGGSPTRLSSGSHVAPGDQLFLTIDVSRSVFVYVINRDDEGQSFLLFPLPGMAFGNPINTGGTQRLPGSIDSEEHYWQVTSVGGREHFFVYVSPERLTEFESLLAALPRAELGRPVSSVPLSSVAVQMLRGVGGLAPATTASSNSENVSLSDLPVLPDTGEIANGLWARRITLENSQR